MPERTNKVWASAYGDILKQAFNLYNINNAEFAAEIHVAEATIRQWFTGRGFPVTDASSRLYAGIKKSICDMSDAALDIEMGVFLTDRLESIGYNCEPYHPTEDDMGKYLTNKLRLCCARGKQPTLKQTDSISKTGSYKPTGRIQAVVFDFDGTLTEPFDYQSRKHSLAQTTWESIWVELGYDVKECRDLHAQFDKGEISHPKWCLITEEKFKACNLHKETLLGIAKKINLIEGCEETFIKLYERNVKIYIVSGSILLIIQKVLNDLYQYIDDVKANDLRFSSDGLLTDIIGTAYDFEGKAKFILEICAKLRISTKDVLFVGNSYNDEFAHLSGAQTLCINPVLVNPTNTKIWHKNIQDCKSLTRILELYDFEC